MIDLAFLEEMLFRLKKGRSGDPTQLDMLEEMIQDWIDEKEEQLTPTPERRPQCFTPTQP